jgi:hypothetical protein
MASAERPVVDAEHPRRRSLRHGGTPHYAQERGRAGRHPEPAHEPSPRLATQRERQQAEDRLEPRRPPSVRGHEPRQPFGEDPPRAGWLAAQELADMQVEPDRLATPWQVSGRPRVVAVDRLGPRSAAGTRPSRSRGLKSGDDLVRSDQHVSALAIATGRKEAGGEGAGAWHRSKSYRPPSASSPKSILVANSVKGIAGGFQAPGCRSVSRRGCSVIRPREGATGIRHQYQNRGRARLGYKYVLLRWHDDPHGGPYDACRPDGASWDPVVHSPPM